jgi:hypothetical protein
MYCIVSTWLVGERGKGKKNERGKVKEEKERMKENVSKYNLTRSTKTLQMCDVVVVVDATFQKRRFLKRCLTNAYHHV